MPRFPALRASFVPLLLTAWVLNASPASAQPASAPRPSAGYAWVDTVFAGIAPDGPGCTVAAARDGRTLFARSYGMAEVAGRRSATPSTVYGTASVGKAITALSVVLLARDGRLSLDDDVRRWVPELPDYGHVITLRQLLAHTGGVRDVFGLVFMQRGHEAPVTDPAAMEMILRQRELNFVPGTDGAYSNSGYVLLARVVERASGRTLPQFAGARILRPLGMRGTTFVADADPARAGRLAMGYVHGDGGWEARTETVPVVGPGGLYSTAEDLLRLAEGLRTGRVGGMEAMREMETNATLADGFPLPYGLGLELEERHGTRIVGHRGSGSGYRAEMLHVRDYALSVAATCNADTVPLSDLLRQVVDGLLPEPASSAPEPAPAPADASAPVAVDARELARIAGVYVTRAGLVRRFFVDDAGSLRLPVPGAVHTLVPLGGGRFRVPTSMGTVYRFVDGTARRESPGDPTIVFQYAAPNGDSAAAPARYAGQYESPELGATWELVAGGDGTLRVVHGGPDSPEAAEPVFRDGYTIAYGLMHFITDCRGEVIGFTLSDERVQALRFNRAGVDASAPCPAPAPR
ncbi:serine hydrolase domain-containing protein [Longimicrobium sp.]|uniref:serine hydrolase domain-containing protein n=1 Tax=Longimicrobium sp. TaxID=2029185 RepID=UPI002E2EAD3B|nr:serine hydrolase domain-containing protein [Longimicrobium sp.]HEX6036545.1 serine hydrolase domain-containing protein [Longimicrobium sp.]